MVNVLEDPLAFLLLNGASPPPHWYGTHPNTSLPTNSSLLPVNSYTAADWLFTSSPGIFGLVAGWALPTGVGLWMVLGIMVICSMKWVRESGNFEVSHPSFLALETTTLPYYSPAWWHNVFI